ncbi:MAG: hypothetical protein ACLFR0_08205 [Alphaproteobacteria bacterium]
MKNIIISEINKALNHKGQHRGFAYIGDGITKSSIFKAFNDAAKDMKLDIKEFDQADVRNLVEDLKSAFRASNGEPLIALVDSTPTEHDTCDKDFELAIDMANKIDTLLSEHQNVIYVQISDSSSLAGRITIEPFNP